MDETLMRPLDGEKLTTADLEYLLEVLPKLLSAAGVHPSTMDMIVARPADLHFIAEHSPVEEMVNVVAASGSGVAFVRHTEFQAVSLLDDVDYDGEDPERDQQDEELSPAVEKVLEDALLRQGEICQVTLTWSLNGLLCYWQANAKWAQVLQTAFDEAQESASGEELEANQERQEALHQEIGMVVDAVMADPAYRATLPQKRRGAVESVLKGMVIDDALRGELWLTVRISQRTSEDAADRAFDIQSRMGELAGQLAETTEWAEARGVAGKKVIAGEFLMQAYDGWRMPTALVEELRVAATRLTP